MTYAERLKDPRWQKKRLQILQRDGFKCMLCDSEKDCLHVHHLYYKSRVEIWDHPDDSLITYCEHCHTIVEYLKKEDSSFQPLRVEKFRIASEVSTSLCLIKNVNIDKNELIVIKFVNLKIIEGLYFSADLLDTVINLLSFKEKKDGE